MSFAINTSRRSESILVVYRDALVQDCEGGGSDASLAQRVLNNYLTMTAPSRRGLYQCVWKRRCARCGSQTAGDGRTRRDTLHHYSRRRNHACGRKGTSSSAQVDGKDRSAFNLIPIKRMTRWTFQSCHRHCAPFEVRLRKDQLHFQRVAGSKG
jgi:hypothetical protein